VRTLFYGLFSAWVLWCRQHADPEARKGFSAMGAAWHLRLPVLRGLFKAVNTPGTLGPLRLDEVLEWAAATLREREPSPLSGAAGTMTRPHRSLRPGDILRVRNDFPRHRLDDDHIDFLRVHYDTESPGLGHVVEVLDDGMIIRLWGHLFKTPELATASYLRPLNRIERLLAPQRLGEFILCREVETGQVVMDVSRPRPRQRLMWLLLRRTRDDLPILKALGGRIHPPVRRRLKSRLFHRLGRLGIMPAMSGFLDRGMLIDHIGVTVELSYSGRSRTLWLDRILLHKNHSIHLVGIDLDNDEQRTFRLDRVTGISVPPLGEVGRESLYWELQSLCMSREGWLWYWNRHQAELGRPPGPAIGPIWRAFSRLLKAGAVIGTLPDIIARAVPALRRTWGRSSHACRRLISDTGKRIRAFQSANQPANRRYMSQAAPTAEMPPWRRRLLRALTTIEAGGVDQITCLLPMNALLNDARRSHAYLRHLVELTLAEALADSAGHPLAPRLLAEALELTSGMPRMVPMSEREAARFLMARLRGLQPGQKRISIRATRRSGKDHRLLLCEYFLYAVYPIWESDAPWDKNQWERTTASSPDQYHFYRTSAHFMAGWDNLRYRVDAASAPRLRTIIDWWDTALAADL
jgi:hypothetical protein